MELKQLAGNCDLYDVMRRQKRRQKHINSSAAKAYKNKNDRKQSDGYVFDIINHKLSSRKTGCTSSSSHGSCIVVVEATWFIDLSFSFLMRVASASCSVCPDFTDHSLLPGLTNLIVMASQAAKENLFKNLV